jgi:ribonucleotide monophosphatase NagD (HAD superfamily)
MLFELALKRANSLPEEAIMIGDRLDTDILGAQKMGMYTALVLSGISDRDMVAGWNPPPHIIAKNALNVIDTIGKIHDKSI